MRLIGNMQNLTGNQRKGYLYYVLTILGTISSALLWKVDYILTELSEPPSGDF